MVKHQDKIFTVTRLSAQGESRLHEKVSIGLGGHVNPKDAAHSEKPWESALKRELQEEVLIQGTWEAKWIGFLNDDDTSVGKVHFGVVYKIESLTGKVGILETHKMKGDFLSLSETEVLFDKMESWSQFLFSAWCRQNFSSAGLKK
jgi:predicted NUDIX family phosphoesterase